MLCRMPALTQTCLLFWIYFYHPLGHWGLTIRQEVFLSSYFKLDVFFRNISSFFFFFFWDGGSGGWEVQTVFLAFQEHRYIALLYMHVCMYGVCHVTMFPVGNSAIGSVDKHRHETCWVNVATIRYLLSSSFRKPGHITLALTYSPSWVPNSWNYFKNIK